MIAPLLALAALASATPAALIAPVDFSELALLSDFIVRGEVVATCRVGLSGAIIEDGDEAREPALKMAQIRVDEVLRGPAGLQTVWIDAHSTWTCDVSSAEVGERALWLLELRPHHLRFPTPGSSHSDILPGEQATAGIARRTGGLPLHTIAWSGHGKLNLGEHEGSAWVTGWDTVIPPAGGQFLGEALEGEYRHLYWTASLAEVEGWLHATLESRGGHLPLHPHTRAPATVAVATEGRVVLAGWEDGTIAWSAHDDLGGPPYWTERGDSDRWNWLRDWRAEWLRDRNPPLPGRTPFVPEPLGKATLAPGWTDADVTLRHPSACLSLAVDPSGSDATVDAALARDLLRRLLDEIPAAAGAERLETLELETFPRSRR